MHRSAAFAALAAVGVGAAGYIAQASGQETVVTLTKQTFTVQEKDTNDFAFVDNAPKTKIGREGPRRLSPGDQLAFRSRLVRDGKAVGSLWAHCLVVKGRTFGSASGDCTGTYDLGDGKLFVGVGGEKIFSAKEVVGAVTGGTGAYAGATGTFSSPNKDNTTDTFTIYVPTG
jgi:hypothetical protein